MPIPLEDPALFTASPKWQSYIRTDPLTLRRITLRFVQADRRLARVALQATAIEQPVLLALAGHDPIVDNRRTLEFFQRLGSPDRTQFEYPNAGHTLEFEPDPFPFLNDLAGWVQKIEERRT